MSYIVCGWYTPDYGHWVPHLKADLERVGCAYDFVEVPKVVGHWEHITLRKAAEVRAAMKRHPDKTIIFLDVDCNVYGPLDELAQTRADVRLFMRVKRRSTGEVKWGNIRSGTMVFNPTPGARELVDLWVEESDNAQFGDVDQTALALGFSRMVDTTWAPIPLAYCATRGDAHPSPVILHDSASKHTSKISNLRRRFTQITGIGNAA
jgi:hypothetical protein